MYDTKSAPIVDSQVAPSISEMDDDELYGKLDNIGQLLSAKRLEAITGRSDSGIEEEWTEDEEYYEGIDDTNRGELKAWRGKPLGEASPGSDDADQRGSTIFMNITRPYVDATSARMGDMLLPTDDKPWQIRPTPMPEYIDIAKGKLSRSIKNAIEQAMPGDPEGQELEMQNVQVQLEDELEQANESAKRAEQQIWDWHVECQYHAENRRVIDDTTKAGTGCLKGPMPAQTKKWVYLEGQLKLIEDVKPVSKRIYYRNIYPDPACGESIHFGNYIWERDDITHRELKNLDGVEGYNTVQIQKCLQEGPQEYTKQLSDGSDDTGLKASVEARKSMFEVWYYFGSMKVADLLAIDALSGAENDVDENVQDQEVDVVVTMVNDRVIKAQLSHLEGGEFPYDLMVWQRRVGMPWGIGISRQLRPAQRMVVGAVRHMMDNAGIAGGPMLFVNDEIVQPEDGNMEIMPWKVWIAGPGYEEGMDMKDAIQFLTAPMIQQELQAIVELGLKFGEDITGLPLIMQGQTNSRTPNTLGGMQLQNNNSSTVLRRVARSYDDMVTSPHVRRYYDYLLQYSEDDEAKGDFVVEALGSSALIERDLANQATMGLGQYVLNPVFGIDPKKWMEENLKSSKLNIKKFQYDDEEWKKTVEQMSQPAPDPRVEIASMNVESRALEAEKDRALKMGLAEMEREFDIYTKEMGDDASMSQSALQAKESMAEVLIKLKAQFAMQGQDGMGGELTAPPVEPVGRAPDGQAYAQ
jgi:hypothetical protein